MEATNSTEQFLFGGFRLEVRAHQLYKDNVRVPITTKAFDTLLALVRRHGEVVTKDELISDVWPDTFVSEDSLTQNISSLRRLLEDDPAQPHFIATVARRGYRFIAPVTEVDHPSSDLASQPVTVQVAAPEPPAAAAPAPTTAATPQATPPARTAVRSRIGWGLVGILVLLGGVALGVLLPANRTPSVLVEHRLRFITELPSGSMPASGGVVSPNGRHVAFVARDRLTGETKLWVRTLSSGMSYTIPGSDGALRPFWSPDSEAIAFFGGGRLRRASLSGGTPLLICDTVVPRPSGGTWNDRGEILFGDAGALLIVPAGGGQPKIVREPSAAGNEISVGWPQFLPDGRTFLYEVVSFDESVTGIYAGSLDQPTSTKLLDAAGTQVAYTRDHLIYVQDGRLFARGFDAASIRFTGDSFFVVDATSPNAAVSAATDAAIIALGGGAAEELVEFNRDGQILRTYTGTPPLRNLTLSSDQRTLIGEAIETSRRGIWLIDLMRRVPTRLVNDGTWPVLLPDGRTVAYSAAREAGMSGLYLRDMESGADQLLLRSAHRPIVSDVSTDAEIIAYTQVHNATTRQDIWTVSRTNPDHPVRVISSTAREIHPEISPDGRWIAYASDEEGSMFNVYIDTFPRLGQKRRISTNGGTQPQWRGDGQELFYLSADQTIMAVGVTTNRGLELTPARPLFQPPLLGHTSDFRNQYTVSLDGQNFFVGVAAVSSNYEPISLIVNWRESVD